MHQAFHPTHPDHTLSPYTGLTREGWIEAGLHLLSGAFRHIKRFEDPMVLPREETEITYPHATSPKDIYEAERRAEMFEGLARTFLIAAPLLRNDPDLTLNGYRLADYYKSHILRSCTPGDPVYIGTYEDLQEMTHHADPFRPFQQTVETCALVIGLWSSREAVWDTFSKEEKDLVAGFISSFAHASTVPQNWRFFNLLDLAFLHMNGYAVDEEIMMDHASELLAYYAGDGWYRDGHSFDYYSCWAFQVYAPIWNVWYGYEHAPEMAARFEENANRLMATYPDMFDEAGHTNMWGRSCIYRFAATSPLDANFYLKHPAVNPGLARRICSGSLLQFLSREDFYHDGIPTMGFYGRFSPLVQGYSCAESPYWMGKAFLCLDLPADHPFWTAREENGSWETLAPREIKTTTLPGPALSFSDHKANGAVILRTGKVLKNCGDLHGAWNYGKLSYHSQYPWEATPKGEDLAFGEILGASADKATAGTGAAEIARLEDSADCSAEIARLAPGTNDSACADAAKSVSTPNAAPLHPAMESQQYILTDVTTGGEEFANVTFWAGERDGILYRRQFFNYILERDFNWTQAVSLADFPVASGVLRADRIRLHRRPVTLTLGAWGFPDNGTEITWKSEGKAKAVILKGRDSLGNPKHLAMTIYDGWEDLRVRRSTGTNPDSEHSLVAYAVTNRRKQYGGAEAYVLISQTITRESHEDFTDEELFPIREVVYADRFGAGGFGPVRIILKSGEEKTVDFAGMEGYLLM